MNQTNAKDFIELLEVFSIALVNGLLDKSEIVKWADKIITSNSEPDYFIIELSLSGHKNTNEVVSLINEFVGQEKPQVSSRAILGFLYRGYSAGLIPLKKVVVTFNWIVWEADLTEKEKSFIYELNENYDCAQEGIYGTIVAVEKETLRLLEIYKDFQIDNYNSWTEINATIGDKIDLLLETVRQEQIALTNVKRKHAKPRWWRLW